MKRAADLTYGRITEEELKSLGTRIGKKFRDKMPWITLVSRDAIRHWACGIGDDNPLWLDEEYTGKTRYGGIIAPPTILYACDRVASGYVGGLPGVHAMYSGTNWKWFKVIRENDRFEAVSMLKDLVEKESKFAGRAIQQIYETTFINQNGEIVAEAESWCFRTERDTAAGRGKYLEKVKELKLKPLARIKANAVVGCDAELMLTGPLYATPKVLQKAGLTMADIDIFEVNEAFAPIPLAWRKELNAPMEKLNVNGGALALGHPVGNSGCRLSITAIYELIRRRAKYALVTLCTGGAMAPATIFERV